MFGAFIKELRTRQGLSLRKFCEKHEHDPSNWSKVERGIFRPPTDKSVLRSWAQQLGLIEKSNDWGKFFELADLAAIEKISDGLGKDVVSSHIPPPATSRPEKLPLGDENLFWKQFEAFCLEFISKQPGIETCHHYGMQGSKQHGIDILATRKDGQTWTFQCKQVRKFTPADVKKVIGITSYKADRHFLFLSTEVDSGVRDILRLNPKWELWDVRDIARKVRDMPSDKAHALVETHFGPQWRKLFLGLSASSPFMRPDQYFQQFTDRSRLYNHNWNLVGRTETLPKLNAFAKSKQHRIGIVSGRGGIGKTKLLFAFTELFQKEIPDHVVWMVKEQVPITPPAIDDLPPQPALFIVDDAHRRDDLPTLISFLNSRPGSKLLLSARPQGMDNLLSILSRSGYDPSETIIFPEIKHLSRTEVRELAGQALGCNDTEFIERLTEATWDCPLVTVVGGQLLAQKLIEPNLLERNEDFRFAVLNRFQEEMVGRIGNTAPDNTAPDICRKLLEIISATAPVRVDDREFFENAAGFINIDQQNFISPETVVSYVGEFEKVGILLRRGRMLRITPDVLGDHILGKFCLAPNDMPTGNAEKIFNHFAGSHAGNVLKNLSELDWRIERTSGKARNLLSAVWQRIEQSFVKGDAAVRCRIMEMLEDAAYFQPAYCLRIVKLASKYRTHKKKRVKNQDLFDIAIDNTDVLRRLPKVLRNIAFTADFLRDCCDLLWKLGRADHRVLSQFPDHPMRVLQDLASYQTKKPTYFNALILDCVTKWLSDSEDYQGISCALDILDKLLEKSGDSHRTEGPKVVITAFLVDPESTKNIRERAIALLQQCARCDDLKVVFRVLGSFKKLLHDDFRMAFDLATPEHRAKWLPEKLNILSRIGQVAVAMPKNPYVQWKVMETLDWPSRESSHKEIRDEAKKAISNIVDSFELRLVRSLITDPLFQPRPPEKEEDWDKAFDEAEKRRAQFHASVAMECVECYKNAQHLFKTLDQYLLMLKTLGINIWPNHLLHEIGLAKPAIAAELAKCLIKYPNSSLSPYFHVLIAAMSHRGVAITSLLENASRSKSSVLLHSLAHHFWFANRQANFDEQNLVVFKKLLKNKATGASRLALESIQFLGKHDPSLAIELILATDFSDAERASAVCQCFYSSHGIDANKMTDGQFAELVDRLSKVADLQDHWIQEFLSKAVTRIPVKVSELFIERILTKARSKDSEFRPVPFHFSIDFTPFTTHPQFPATLRKIRNVALRRPWQYPYFASQLYWAIANDTIGLSVLREWIDTRDENKIRGAARILEEGGDNLVFNHPDYVSELIEAAASVSDKCYREVCSSLAVSATSGSRSGTVGQPMPRDVEIKERALQCAAQFALRPNIRSFFENIARGAEASIRRDMEDYEEMFSDA